MLQQVVEGSHANSLTKVIVETLLLYGGLSEFDLALKLVCFGVDVVMMFQVQKLRL
jgi:hypothetical protein